MWPVWERIGSEFTVAQCEMGWVTERGLADGWHRTGERTSGRKTGSRGGMKTTESNLTCFKFKKTAQMSVGEDALLGTGGPNVCLLCWQRQLVGGVCDTPTLMYQPPLYYRFREFDALQEFHLAEQITSAVQKKRTEFNTEDSYTVYQENNGRLFCTNSTLLPSRYQHQEILQMLDTSIITIPCPHFKELTIKLHLM